MKVLFYISLLLFVTACDPDRVCKKAQDCALHGLCAVGADKGCIAKSDEHCKESRDCHVEGKCSAKDKACAAVSDAAHDVANLMEQPHKPVAGGPVVFHHQDPRCGRRIG